jgi:hypothetical protein
VFNDDSLLHKSLRNTLTGEQFTRYDTVVRERGASQHRANIERVVTMIEQNTPLRDAQRREFITLLTNETKPARTQSQYDFYLIALQIGRLPEAKLKPLFDDTQWKAVTEFLNRYKGIEPALRQNGVIVDDDREAGGDDALPAAVLKRSDS